MRILMILFHYLLFPIHTQQQPFPPTLVIGYSLQLPWLLNNGKGLSCTDPSEWAVRFIICSISLASTLGPTGAKVAIAFV